MPPTVRGVRRLKELVNSPAHPLSNPITSKFFEQATRVAARMAAFIPGASPPEVTIPIVFTNRTRFLSIDA